jgi:hypothetical protein
MNAIAIMVIIQIFFKLAPIIYSKATEVHVIFFRFGKCLRHFYRSN